MFYNGPPPASSAKDKVEKLSYNGPPLTSTVVAHCKTEFSDFILATTGRWWPIVRQSFPILSLSLLVGGGPL
jgi:hypothetical protein